MRELADLEIEWHFIGHIQSNKTRDIAYHFDWAHSVERLRIAQRLSDQRPPDLPPLNICLQINLSEEISKSGTTLKELVQLAHGVAQFPRIQLRGLMAIPARSDEIEEQRRVFRSLRNARDFLEKEGIRLDTLSMGMSNDMEAAIAEGATIVRIGTDIFGPR